MYKLIILSNNTNAVEFIKSAIYNNRIPLRIVGEFNNFTQGKQAIMEILPEIVVADMDSNAVSCITLSKQLSADKLPIKLIALKSSNSEISPQSHNADNIVDCIITPVDISQATDVLLNIVKAFDNEYGYFHIQLQLQKNRLRTLNNIQQSDLSQLLMSEGTDVSLLKKLSVEGIELNRPHSIVATISYDTAISSKQYQDIDVAMYTVRNFFSHWQKRNVEYSCYTVADKTDIIMLLQSSVNFTRKKMDSFFNNLMQELRTSLIDRLSIGISPLISDKESYHSLFTKSQQAVTLAKQLGTDIILYYDDLDKDRASYFMLSKSYYQKIASALTLATLDDVLNALTELLDTVDQKKYIAGSQYIYYNLVCTIVGSCMSSDTLSSIYMTQEEIFDNFFKLSANSDKRQFLLSLAEEVHKVNQLLKLKSTDKNLKIIKKFIQANYQDASLSLSTLSQNTGLSISYISQLLKSDNTTFVEMLSELRISQAKLLLQNRERLIADIAYSVGYSDPYYFSQCFKKSTGMSPRQYRDIMNNNS